MFAKTLIKLIDYAIFPAFLLVAAKILGVVFLAKYFGVNYSLDGIRMVFNNSVEFAAVNSYSSLVMFIAIIAGLVWVIVKAHIFHDTHITPAFSAKLFSMNMDDLIHTTETIFSQAFIWLSYAWLATFIFGIHSYFGLSYWWLFWGALIVSVVSTGFLAMDIEREINADRKEIDDNGSSSSRLVRFEELAEEILA